jgi:hypothetical protein
MNLTVKSVPESLHRQLSQLAQLNRRSLNQEIIWLLESALAPKRVSPENFVLSAKKLREKINLSLTIQDIEQAIESGRP